MAKLIIQPIGSIDRSLLQWLAREIRERFPIVLRARASLWSLSLDYMGAFNWDRMQFDAVEVNKALHRTYKSMIKPRESLVLGIVSGDGYVQGLNYVFGLATPELSTASIYTGRLDTGDYRLYQARVLKEAMHEVGHLLGLGHCANRRCVMSFSDNVSEVDSKDAWFCPSCAMKLKEVAESLKGLE